VTFSAKFSGSTATPAERYEKSLLFVRENSNTATRKLFEMLKYSNFEESWSENAVNKRQTNNQQKGTRWMGESVSDAKRLTSFVCF
jgi:hypothetical protein